MALAVAPEVEPRIGWLYQQLQPGSQSSYPSVTLARELLALDETETGDFYRLLNEESPLRRAHLEITGYEERLFSVSIPFLNGCTPEP